MPTLTPALNRNKSSIRNAPEMKPSRNALIGRLEWVSEIAFLAAIFILPFSKAALEVFLSVAFAFWFVTKIIRNRPLCERQGLFILLGLYIVISSISAFESGYPIVAARGILKLVRYSFITLMALDFYRDPKRLNRLGLVFFASIGVLALDSLAQGLWGKDLIARLPLQYADAQARITGPFRSYGLLAGLLISSLPIMCALGFGKLKISRWSRAGLFLLIPVAFYLLYKTHSRGAWIAVFGAWLVFGFLVRQKIVIFIVLSAIVAVPFLLPRNALIHLDMNQQEQSVIERYYLWDRASQVIKKKPWFGCGINTYSRNYPRLDETKSWRVPGYQVHNGYLQVAAETGIISLALFLALLWRGLSAGFASLKKAAPRQKLLIGGVISGFVALLFQAMVDTTFQSIQSAVLVWFRMGLLLSANDAVGEA